MISTKRPRRAAPLPERLFGGCAWKPGDGAFAFWLLEPDGERGRILDLDFRCRGVPGKQVVRLTSTRPHFGGVRWWFLCPACGRRVMNLYLPNLCLPVRGTRFACRTCHDLAYESEQTNRGRSQAFFRLVSREEGDCSMGAARRIFRGAYGIPMREPGLIVGKELSALK